MRQTIKDRNEFCTQIKTINKQIEKIKKTCESRAERKDISFLFELSRKRVQQNNHWKWNQQWRKLRIELKI